MKSPADRFVEARTRKLKIVNDKLAAAYLNRGEYLGSFDKLTPLSLGIWEKRMHEEWSLAVTSLDIPSSRGLGRRIYDAAMKDHQAMLKASFNEE